MEPLFVLLTLLVVLSSLAPTRRRARLGLLDLFGSGFLPYREDGTWPHGIQEEEPPAWTWDHPDDPSPDKAAPPPGDDRPELIELDERSAVRPQPVNRTGHDRRG